MSEQPSKHQRREHNGVLIIADIPGTAPYYQRQGGYHLGYVFLQLQFTPLGLP